MIPVTHPVPPSLSPSATPQQHETTHHRNTDTGDAAQKESRWNPKGLGHGANREAAYGCRAGEHGGVNAENPPSECVGSGGQERGLMVPLAVVVPQVAPLPTNRAGSWHPCWLVACSILTSGTRSKNSAPAGDRREPARARPSLVGQQAIRARVLPEPSCRSVGLSIVAEIRRPLLNES